VYNLKFESRDLRATMPSCSHVIFLVVTR